MSDPDAKRLLLELLAGITDPDADPPPMSESLARLDVLLRSQRPAYYGALQPGLTDGEWKRLRAEIGLELPDSFRLLYQWKNGQRDDCYESFHQNYQFVPIAAALSTKRLHDSMIGYDFDQPGWWEPTWVPFLHNGGGDHLCLDAPGAYGGRPGQVVEFWHDWEKRRIAYPSLEHWMFRVLASLDPSLDNRHPETDTGPPVGREVW